LNHWLVVCLVGLGILALLGITVLNTRSASRRVSRDTRPGFNPATALAGVPYPDRIPLYESRRCPCGGDLKHHGGGTREHAGRRLDALLGECKRCAETVTMFFEREI